jgi:hypothetical protein
MNTEIPTSSVPPRRSGPHAPLPSALGAPPADTGAPRPETGAAAASGGVPSEDPRVRAAKRAAELREHGKLDADEDDQFYIDPSIVPDGWSYEWKSFTVLGAQDPGYQVSIAQKGWDAVPLYRHPQMMPRGHQGQTIERKGMILMERPLVITNEAKQRELAKARNQVQSKQEQLAGAPAGTFQRKTKDGESLVKIQASVEHQRLEIPDK